MSTDKPHYSYESAYGGKQEVELMISAYTMNDNIYVGMKGLDSDGGTYHYADLTVNIPSAPALEPFQAAIDIEHLGQLDAMNFLSESGLATHTGRYLPSGYMMFPVYEFDAQKLVKADPKGFKDYLKIVGLDAKQVEENSVEDLTSMAKACFLEKTADDEPRRNPFDEILDELEDESLLEDDDGRFMGSDASGIGFAEFDLEGFMQYCEEEGIEPDQIERREDADSLEDAKRQAKERAGEKNTGHYSERDSSKPLPDMEL